ncbi:MAG: acetyl-CoA C-acyltransferase [Bacteroidota bacterium]|jgi:acetyl-CoA acyltransferase
MDAFLLTGFRSAVGKAPRGMFRSVRADELASSIIRHLVHSIPGFEKDWIDDVIVGNATPEAEQGLNLGRMVSLMGLDTVKVPGMTVNRYCASGLETIAIAASKIHAGLADCIIAGGVETMSPIPFGGWRIVPNYSVAKEHPEWYWGMGLTAEAVAKEFSVSRSDQDAFAFESHRRAVNAISNGNFKNEIVPFEFKETYLDDNEKRRTRVTILDKDEGPRADTTLEKLSALKPVFDTMGTVTAGNSSQTSDGAAFVMVVSEKILKRIQAKPIARFMSYAVTALEPRIMGVGPITAIPAALDKAGVNLGQIDLIELNEAFASQSLAVIRELNLDTSIVNVNGGAIALGHPLGCSGAKLTVQVLNELRRRNKKHGLVTMCVGTGQGAAGVFELID